MATAAVVPLVAYGFVSVFTARAANKRAVIEGNQNVAARAAEQIQLYVAKHVQILQALAAQLQQTQLAPWQKERIVRNFALRFAEFREITLFDEHGTVTTTSRVSGARVRPPAPNEAHNPDQQITTSPGHQVHLSPVTIDNDLLPTTRLSVPLEELGRQVGWLVGEVSLEEMWRLVDRIKIGEHGAALVVAHSGELLAHGDPNEKPRVAKGDKLPEHPLVQAAQTREAGARIAPVEYDRPDGTRVLAVAHPLASPPWTVIVEQPTAEAYAVSRRLERTLWAAVAIALALMIGTGYLWGRRTLIRPILELMRGTRALVQDEEALATTRVRPQGAEEFRQLGESFNRMADRLVALTEQAKENARQVMFGRIAGGLAHDIKHPFKTIKAHYALILREYDDLAYRETWRREMQQQVEMIEGLLDDLHHIGKAKVPEHELHLLDVNHVIKLAAGSMRDRAQDKGITLVAAPHAAPLWIKGELVGVRRVFYNLIANAIEAMKAAGGEKRIEVAGRPAPDASNEIEVTVRDTGCGIEPDRLKTLFDDLKSTKRTGLGLGLAACKRVMEQMNGTISVTSVLGQGTTFTLRFPAAQAEEEEGEVRQQAS